jgi:hypothetical protein
MKKYIYFIIGLLFVPVLASAVSSLSLPMSFWGTAKVNGSDVPVGTVVRSYNASGVLYDSTTVTTAGLYGTDNLDQANPAEDRLLFDGDGTITFKAIIPGYSSGAEVTAAETETYTEGTVERKNLTFTATADTAPADVCDPSSVSHGTVAPYPGCGITCNSGYYKSGNSCLVSGGGSYSGGGGDTTAPAISGIAATLSDTTAIITWTTNESSISWVVYGTSTNYGSEKKTTSYVTSHSVTLSGLIAEKTYHYQVKSKDSSGNIGTYTDKTFTTLATGLAPEPEPVTGPMTVDQLRAEILRITTLIAQLQAKLAELLGGAAIEGIPAGFSFEKNLEIGDVLIDVKYLQIVLNSDPITKLAESGVGSPGNETNYFGPLTKSAVIKFQEKYADKILASWGLTSGTGYVGSTTRDKLNELLGR